MTIHLDPWQEEVLKHKGDILLCTGRRIGKTYIMARKAIDRMMKSKIPIIVVSLTEDQAMLIIIFALNYAKEAYPKSIMKGNTKTNTKKITFKNGSTIISRPVGATGDSVRGFEGGVLIVDEASRMPPLFWMAAKPIILMTVGEIWMCSTPFGKQGYFWERFDEAWNLKKPNARFTVFYKTTVEVCNEREISESWTKEQREGTLETLKTEQEEMSELEFGQEYLGLFMEDLKQYFPDDLIEELMILERRDKIIQGRDYYYGADVARKERDEFTHEIFDGTDPENIEHVENIMTKNIPLPDSVRRIIELNTLYNFNKEYIDSGGMGIGVCDLLRESDENQFKVVEINNASRKYREAGEDKKKGILKEDQYENTMKLMRQHRVKFLDDPEIKASFRSIQYEIKEGQVRYFGNYAHIVEGCNRGLWFAKGKIFKVFARRF